MFTNQPKININKESNVDTKTETNTDVVTSNCDT